MTRVLLAFVILLGGLVPALSAMDNPLAPAPAWTGSYSGDGLTLELAADGAGAYAGSITLKGRRYPARATGDATQLQGSFTAGEHSFPFSVRAGSPVVLSSGGTDYHLQRAAPANPLAGGGGPVGATAPAPAAASAPAAAGLTELYKHELGLQFRHPPGWRVQQPQPGTLVLTPPDVQMAGGQPMELYYLQGFAKTEVPDLATPAAEQQVQALMQQLLPGFRSDGPAQRIEHEGDTVLAMGWSGSNPAVQPPVQLGARLWARPIEDWIICFLVVTPVERRAAREATAEGIFLSMAYEQPPVDARIVGSWRNTETYLSGEFSAITETYLNLFADGQCSMGGRMMAGMEHHDASGHATGSSSADTGDPNMDYGRWTFADKQLVIDWRDGSRSSWTVVLSGDSMLLKSGGSKKLYERTR